MFLEPKKSLGQNFLKSPKVLNDFIQACDLSKNDVVLEVGAGTGAVTRELAEVAGKVIAVEFDRDLVEALKESLKDYSNVEIVNDDILQIFPTSLAVGELHRAGNLKIVGSIPYSITSPLIGKIYELKQKPTLICLIVQWEVAKKICAKPPNASYLSNLVATFGEAKIIRKIPPGAFCPAPRVDSAILRIVTHNKYPDIRTKEFSQFLHKGFKHPRKKIKQVFTLEELLKVGIDPSLRPENLSLLNWLNLFNLGVSHLGYSHMR
ncbi:16S rRNA (adenine(1518)-N(6)/adenine(1519)-N(6))-dimethyltransferase RsmA [Candidatus Parcubacteria bacterium]|nr:ribosomal RNA small subunit methyltransferase A [Patescibacteria group bacterium]MBU4380653.1 ribosomal RNA small subunit methyltransferase A [Patescibacteria group bacterium]MCG2689570.1 16S rRNA (adenine(1518)-N(6)/adenine(1519)-N(6))-dimethyltransferase RsmA [Candidatus Parcubacteria bacterium]